MKKGKTHYGAPFSGELWPACEWNVNLTLTTDASKVTCKRCIRLLGQRERNIANGAPRVGEP